MLSNKDHCTFCHFIGKDSSKYMKTGFTSKGRTKEEVTADKSRGGGNSSMYMKTGSTSKGRSKEEVTTDKSRGGKSGGTATLGVEKTKSDGSKNDWMTIELISHPSGEPFTTRASQTKASLIAALHHRNAFGPLQKKQKQRRFNKYYDDAKAKNNSCTFVCEQGGKWKLTLSKDRPIGVSTVFSEEELNATSADRKKDEEERRATRKRKKN